MKSIFYLFIIIVLALPASSNSQSRSTERVPRDRPISRMPRDNTRGRNNEKINRKTRPQNPEAKTKIRESKIRRQQKPIESHPILIKKVEQDYPVDPGHDVMPPTEECNNDIYIFDGEFEPLRPEEINLEIDYEPSETEIYNSALENYNSAIKNFPEDTVLYFLRGVVKTKLEDYPGAIEDLTIYLNAFPKDEEACYQRGLAFLFNLDRKNAFLDFQFSYYLGSDKSEEILKKYF